MNCKNHKWETILIYDDNLIVQNCKTCDKVREINALKEEITYFKEVKK